MFNLPWFKESLWFSWFRYFTKKKLYQNEFRGPAFNLLQPYLRGRMICTKIGKKTSKLCAVENEVPQRSILDLLLFSLYVNDLLDVSNLETTLFADYTNPHISHKSIKNLQTGIINKMKKIEMWMKVNKLTTNYKKVATFWLVKRVLTSLRISKSVLIIILSNQKIASSI